jgi:hypothetical protein
MDLHKIGIKFFAEKNNTVELTAFIPLFHRWIQQKALENLLIDVADYSHVKSGPGIVLVAHEGNYAIDETGNRRGLVYYSKHILPGGLEKRLEIVCRHALIACKLLQNNQEINSRLIFPGKELQLFANDRLHAPNTDETWDKLQPVVQGFLNKLFTGTEYSIRRETDPDERFTVNVVADQPVAIETLLERISSQ